MGSKLGRNCILTKTANCIQTIQAIYTEENIYILYDEVFFPVKFQIFCM